jgi:hypothetical protein
MGGNDRQTPFRETLEVRAERSNWFPNEQRTLPEERSKNGSASGEEREGTNQEMGRCRFLKKEEAAALRGGAASLVERALEN